MARCGFDGKEVIMLSVVSLMSCSEVFLVHMQACTPASYSSKARL